MDLLHKTVKKRNHLTEKHKIKVTQKIQNFHKIAKFKSHKIWEPQNHERNVL